MRIAQVAPLTEAVPPKLYGGTERVVSWLTEELVMLGHDVLRLGVTEDAPGPGHGLPSGGIGIERGANQGARCVVGEHAGSGRRSRA